MRRMALAIILVCLFTVNSYASLQFDGANDYIAIPDSDNWNFGTQNFTIECWVKLTDVARQQIIWGQGQNSSGIWFLYVMQEHPTFQFYSGGAGMSDVINFYGNHTMVPNIWYHVVITRVGNDFNMYLNSVNIGHITDSDTMKSASGPLCFGIYSDDLSRFAMGGGMGEVRIWDSGMTQSDVEYWMDNSPSGSESDLLGYWKLDETSGDVAHDYSSYGNNGQVNGGIWIPAEPAIPEPATMLLLPLGLAGFRFLRRKKE